MQRRSLLRATLITAAVAAVAVGGASAAVTAPSSAGPHAAKPLPRWAIGPFHRYAGNPILTPPTDPTDRTSWEWPEAFNPSVVVVNGVFHMLYRGAASGNYSSIGAATSRNGHHFTEATNNPVIRRALPSEKHGVEDPRMYYSHGRYYAFFTGYDGTNIGINEATSTDALHWKQLGRVVPDTKNAAVVSDPRGRPVKIHGRYLMYYGQTGGTAIAASSDLVHWHKYATVNPHFPKSYDPFEFCVAITNYPVGRNHLSKNILLFDAGHLMGHGRWYYAISEVLFSRSHLRSPSAQLHRPVLQPHAPYEIYGYTPHTVFMNNIIEYRGRWWMYYGAGDSVVALATAPVHFAR